MIDLIDQETGRRARCAVIFHGQAAAEITADALETWARKVRRLRLVRRALTAAGPACVAGLFPGSTFPTPTACASPGWPTSSTSWTPNRRNGATVADRAAVDPFDVKQPQPQPNQNTIKKGMEMTIKHKKGAAASAVMLYDLGTWRAGRCRVTWTADGSREISDADLMTWARWICRARHVRAAFDYRARLELGTYDGRGPIRAVDRLGRTRATVDTLKEF